MGITGGMLFGQTDLLQHGNHAAANLSGIGNAADLQTFADDLFDGHTGVQRLDRILEDHGDVIGQILTQFLGHLTGDVLAVENHFAGGGIVQTDDGTAGSGLTTAGLTDQTKGLGGMDAEADVVNRMDGDLFLTLTRGEGLAKVLYFEDVIRISHC